MFEWYDDQWSCVLPTRGKFSGTMTIGLSFVFIAYVLHPAVEKAFQRVRAYRGWRAIERSETVEVTTYSLASEIFGVRGRWDAARIVAVLLAAFSLASWGLELLMGLTNIEEYVTDLHLRPPPVWKKDINSDNWYVIRPDELDIDDESEVHNTNGNFVVGTANARYEVNNVKGIIDGNVRIASWDTDLEDIEDQLFYYTGEGIGNVTSHDCFSDETPVDLYVDNNNESWGTVVDCKNGPERLGKHNDSTPNVVKLTNGTGNVHFIVEESTTYPSFLYSVWEAQNGTNDSFILRYVFYISSSVRLAEAVVTEIVHADRESRDPTGGRSFALLRVFSEKNSSYGMDMEDRASPFGEHPTGEQPVGIRLSTIETVEEGVKLDTAALLCAVCLMVLALVGIAWSLLLRSSVETDIYDRDELIRAVTLAGSADSAVDSSKMRIFVRKEEGENLRVVINDAELHSRNCVQRCRKKHKVVAINVPMPKYPSYDPSESDGPVVPNRTRTVWLEGVRMGKGRAYPGRRGNYRYPTSIALIASPVPSSPVSIVGTPVHQLASPADVPPRIRQFPGVDPALFASMRSTGSCEENNGGVEMVTAGSSEEPKVKSSIEMGYPSLRRSESHKTEITDLRGLRLFSESTSTLHDRSLMSPSARLTARSAFNTPERLGPSPTDLGDEVKDDPNDYSEAGVAETEGDIVHDGGNELV